ncbi:hypothetical protein SCH01S_14_00210 [Sphingomonas changbaiensis NBRC 104936]|uniref:Uncharacterized protein n=1 Tax=Sphingomonas changbaiensis NBRC 104936 TaxID=1219043 RepID=A0A0E9MKM6_9SPHN|nr:hypothetical protein [Sphingomonas changbaiensis]GAO38357.1 hypothetical protein SCH01S_14_00210 [Sphingomonas changbaiensis NBRC 104936]
MNSIFTHERRDYIARAERRMNRESRIHGTVRLVGLVILLGLLAILAWREVAPAIAAGPAPAQPYVLYNGERVDLVSFCARYRSDSLMTGQKMNPDVVARCGF